MITLENYLHHDRPWP